MTFIVAGILFLVLVAGLVVFFVARKVMKMAVRLAIVGVVLLVVIVGGISLWYFNSSGGGNDNRPPATRKAR
jgi:hypothetical protein